VIKCYRPSALILLREREGEGEERLSLSLGNGEGKPVAGWEGKEGTRIPIRGLLARPSVLAYLYLAEPLDPYP